MCFAIAPKQRPWKRTIVYKMMYVTNDYETYLRNKDNPIKVLYSPYHAMSIRRKLGAWMHASKKKFESFGTAKAGIYVFKFKKDAEAIADSLYRVVVTCEVDPKDFLYHDNDNEQATYKKVKLVKIGKFSK
jgi:hypothetical protein